MLRLALLAALLSSTALAQKAPGCARAQRFSAKVLPGKSTLERYQAYLAACADERVLELAKALIAFKTVSAEASADVNPEFARMEKFLSAWARKHGLGFRTVGARDVFELSLGTGAPRLGLVFHGDVVPAPAHEWKAPPFEAFVKEGKLYGRGAEDDKGPLATAMVAVAMARELGLKPAGKIVLAIGNGEESSWAGMQRYATSEPKPTHVISVDSSFPVVTAQSGFVSWFLEAPVDAAQTDGGVGVGAVAVDAQAGEFLTQVPGRATLTLQPVGTSADALVKKVEQEVAKLKPSRPKLQAQVTVQDGRVVVTTLGTAVHSSGASSGHNALWDLSAVASRLGLRPGGIASMLELVASRFDGDHWGKKLGVSYEDSLMGGVLVAPTVLRVADGKVRLSVNMRRPPGKDSVAFRKLLDSAAAGAREKSGGRIQEVDGGYIGEPHVAALEGPLVQTLLDIYRRQRGAPDAGPDFIRGGTYARLFPGAVDFGPAFPDGDYTGHAPDEYISLENLRALTSILGEAVHALAFEERK